MSKNKILFIPKDKETSLILPHPKPSKDYFPEWMKSMKGEYKDVNGNSLPTAKRCVPFIDGFISGYIQELICDVRIKNHGINPETGEDLISYEWPGKIKPMSTRLEDTGAPNTFPSFEGYYNSEFQWYSHWEPKTPAGYSTMYYHPANRFDLPFHTFTGIIDTDKWPITGPVPFLLKKGFEGVIPAGTPIYQFIFIKRDAWESEASEYDEKYEKGTTYSVRKFFTGGYKKQYWSKKQYL
jgi:hypothetical protein